jgi:peroxide stress protein YaaA
MAAAKALYTGKLYSQLAPVWSTVLSRDDVAIRVVSAAYGLVDPTEPLSDYDLTMTHRLRSGMNVARFWRQEGLAECLRRLVDAQGITRVWSLLPGSNGFPYHPVFDSFWKQSGPTDSQWVNIYGPNGRQLQSAIGHYRGLWLAKVVEQWPQALIGDTAGLKEAVRCLPGYEVRFDPCR